jgi:hypothetical protein
VSPALGGAPRDAGPAGRLTEYLTARDTQPLFLLGDALETLRVFPTASVEKPAGRTT